MSVAGVRLAGGRLVWVEAGDWNPQPLDAVTVDADDREYQGQVIVAPQALLRPVTASGKIVQVTPRPTEETDCSNLPGADMPPLGSKQPDGVVVAVDAISRTFTVEAPDGARSVHSQVS